jgi:hypothetical protein
MVIAPSEGMTEIHFANSICQNEYAFKSNPKGLKDP